MTTDRETILALVKDALTEAVAARADGDETTADQLVSYAEDLLKPLQPRLRRASSTGEE